jgi:hypothetical protein
VPAALISSATDAHSNWQWQYLVNRAAAMILDNLPPPIRPMAQVIDEWFTNRKLGLLFEAQVGVGKLIVCSIELDENAGSNPVARQFLQSLLRYAASEAFQPTVELSISQIDSLMNTPS